MRGDTFPLNDRALPDAQQQQNHLWWFLFLTKTRRWDTVSADVYSKEIAEGPMCGCPDSCTGNDACGCDGKSSRFIDEQLTELMNRQLAMRRNFIAALGAKSSLTATEADLVAARALIASEQQEMEKILETVKRALGNKCLEMRVALGGTRE